MAACVALADAVRVALAAHADPTRAAPMQAYMKSALPFHGVPTPLRRQLVADAVRQHPLPDAAALADTVAALWRQATHREQRYAALDLLRWPRHRAHVAWSLLPLLREMIIDGAWWDYNDEISGEALCWLLQREPARMKPLLRRWARGTHRWLRRAAMLSQRSLKTGFDPVLLYDCILPSLAGPSAGPLADDFFICKGMGWALRERSYDAPDEVRAFCAEYADRMSALTRREALKALSRSAAT